MQIRTCVLPALAAAAMAACGGGEILAVVSFLGSAGGDWNVGTPDANGALTPTRCGNEDCFVNIQIAGTRNPYATDFNVTFTGNLSAGCPTALPGGNGMVSGRRISLPGCFVGEYVTINEALSDDRTVRAFFDSEVPNLTDGVWVEIQHGQRRFKFQGNPVEQAVSNIVGCELTTPATTPVLLTVEAADIGSARLQTRITSFTVGTQTGSGAFEGISGMKLTLGAQTLELERRDLPGSC